MGAVKRIGVNTGGGDAPGLNAVIRAAALDPPVVKLVPLAEAVSQMKAVPLDSDILLTARSLGICLGD